MKTVEKRDGNVAIPLEVSIRIVKILQEFERIVQSALVSSGYKTHITVLSTARIS